MMKFAWILAGMLAVTQVSSAYSVLTHEAIVDSLWTDAIIPQIKKRFPDVTAEQLVEAHAYAYGGAIIQDMGYFPFGSKLFSDLAHYVRSGDLVSAMLSGAETFEEYAFALGSLAHYASDTVGHPEAINRVVPMLYPKLRAKYGAVVPYEKDPVAHLKTEFGFDVLEIAHGRYAPQSYHDFIGFKVSKPILERAFEETYSLSLKDIFVNLDLALGTYRKTVGSLIPEMTRVAWQDKRDEIQKSQPGMTKKKFLYNLSRSSYEKEWGQTYEKPGLWARFLAFWFRILPKIGPLRVFSYRVPDPASEKLFMASFNNTVSRYRQLLLLQSTEPLPPLADRNLDTGGLTKRGSYDKEDHAYERLLEKLNDSKQEPNPRLRASILEYYGKTGDATSERARQELSKLR
ncbi:MAG: zinc dependent phospholipase C family protein [Bryobacteraceae bacterium]